MTTLSFRRRFLIGIALRIVYLLDWQEDSVEVFALMNVADLIVTFNLSINLLLILIN
jgi:hypothetical protein